MECESVKLNNVHIKCSLKLNTVKLYYNHPFRTVSELICFRCLQTRVFVTDCIFRATRAVNLSHCFRVRQILVSGAITGGRTVPVTEQTAWCVCVVALTSLNKANILLNRTIRSEEGSFSSCNNI